MSEFSLPSAETVIKTGSTYARDLLERVLTTFLQGTIGALVVTTPLDGSMWHAAGSRRRRRSDLPRQGTRRPLAVRHQQRIIRQGV